MPRSPRVAGLLALASAIILLAACTPAADTSPASSTAPQQPTTTGGAAGTTATATPTTTRALTVPPVDAALLKEATEVFRSMAISMRTVSFDGGFAPSSLPPAYPKYLMGSELMVAILNANTWHDAGYRRVSGTEELLDIRPFPAMQDGSLVALSGCRKQTNVRFESKDGSGWSGGDEQQVAFLKRDTDGLLKIFHTEHLDVTSCDPSSAAPALVAEASAIHGTVLRLFDKHLAAGGLNQADYSTSGFGPYLGHEARTRLLLDLEFARVSDQTSQVHGPTRFGRVTEWPYAREGSVVALTSCLDRSNAIRTTPSGSRYRETPRLFFTYFTRDSAGTLRLATVDAFYVDACA